MSRSGEGQLAKGNSLCKDLKARTSRSCLKKNKNGKETGGVNKEHSRWGDRETGWGHIRKGRVGQKRSFISSLINSFIVYLPATRLSINTKNPNNSGSTFSGYMIRRQLEVVVRPQAKVIQETKPSSKDPLSFFLFLHNSIKFSAVGIFFSTDRHLGDKHRLIVLLSFTLQILHFS